MTLSQGEWRPAGGKRVAQIVNIDKWSGWVIVMLTLGLQVVTIVVMMMIVVVVKVVVMMTIAMQGPAAALFSRLHQAGTVSAVDWIANESNFASYTSGDVRRVMRHVRRVTYFAVAPSVAFLMPCHQYPFYASVHRYA